MKREMVLKNKKKKIVYLALSVDFLHSGHLRIIKLAKKYGNLIIGLMSDKAIIEYKKVCHY